METLQSRAWERGAAKLILIWLMLIFYLILSLNPQHQTLKYKYGNICVY